MFKFKFVARGVLLGLLTTTAVGCGAPEPKVILDQQTAADLQAERDAQAKAIYAQEATTTRDPNSPP